MIKRIQNSDIVIRVQIKAENALKDIISIKKPYRIDDIFQKGEFRWILHYRFENSIFSKKFNENICKLRKEKSIFVYADIPIFSNPNKASDLVRTKPNTLQKIASICDEIEISVYKAK
jgi:hypothetical protein